MPANTRDILRRIKSVNNTKKITKAMEMVAAAKMRRAVEMALATRPYANLAWNTVMHISQIKGQKTKHPLLEKPSAEKVLLVIFSSNRGLCGGYNTQVVQKAVRSLKKHQQPTEIITLGRKGAEMLARQGYKLVADFPKPDLAMGVGDINDAAKFILDKFISQEYGKVMVAYTDFVSSLKQIPRVKQLLPVELEAEELGVLGKDEKMGITPEFIQEKEEKYLQHKGHRFSYVFEPNPRKVLDLMLPRLITVQLYQALLEANASEHSARMLSMRNATDAAGEMIESLTLFYNKARQASVTAEIAEISAGAEAMKNN